MGHVQRGFTLLHLSLLTAVAAYALGLSLPIDLYRATTEQGIVATENGFHALASAALSYHGEEEVWPNDVCDLLLSPSGTNHLGDFESVDCTAPPPHRPRHPLGGAYVFLERTADESASLLPRWRRGGFSIQAQDINDAHARYALAARLGHNSELGATHVSLEVPPFGREASHDGIFASRGTGGIPVSPWTGDLHVGVFNAGPPITFDANVTLAGPDTPLTPSINPPLVGGIVADGQVQVSRAAFDVRPPNIGTIPSDPIEGAANSTVGGNATVLGNIWVNFGSQYVQCECGGHTEAVCNPAVAPPDFDTVTPQYDPHPDCLIAVPTPPGLSVVARGDMTANDFRIEE